MVSRRVPPSSMNMVACVERREWKVMSGRPIFFLAVRNWRWMVVGTRSLLASRIEWKSMVPGSLSGQNFSMCSRIIATALAGMGTTRLLRGALTSASWYEPRSAGPRSTE